MTSITIPKEMTKKGDLVVITRKEYEALVVGRSKTDWMYDPKIVSLIKKRSISTHKEHKSGKTFRWSPGK